VVPGLGYEAARVLDADELTGVSAAAVGRSGDRLGGELVGAALARLGAGADRGERSHDWGFPRARRSEFSASRGGSSIGG